VTDNGNGTFSWSYPTTGKLSDDVFITATDSAGLKGQIPFALDITDVAPTIKKLKVSPKKVKAGKKPKVKLTLSEPAKVEFKIKRAKPKKPKVTDKLSKDFAEAGKQATKLKAKFKRKALPPGKYKLTAKATDSGGLTSKRAKTSFTLKR
jgi:hypothetical protein